MPLSLSDYVRRRNGVVLGAPGSLGNMLNRSLGAGSFAAFWRYQNPIWGYYLSRLVMKPLLRPKPSWLAILLTFAVSGAVHDLAVTLVKWRPTFFLAPWFAMMGGAVLVTDRLGIAYHGFPWAIRATANLSLIGACFWLAYRLVGL